QTVQRMPPATQSWSAVHARWCHRPLGAASLERKESHSFMRRVVVTGVGVLSCIGMNKQEVIASLREGKSGIRFNPEYAEHGLRCQVSGWMDVDFKQYVPKKNLRVTGRAAELSYVA